MPTRHILLHEVPRPMPPSKTDEKAESAAQRRAQLNMVSIAHEVLVKLSGQQFDGATADAILTLRKWAYPHCVRLVGMRDALLEKHAKKVEGESNKWILPQEAAQTLVPKLNELGEELIDIDTKVIGILSTEKLREARISANELEALSIFY